MITNAKNVKESSYTVERHEVRRVPTLKHVGITHQENNKVNVDERAQHWRKTIYALLGSGLHVRSGMSPGVQLKM